MIENCWNESEIAGLNRSHFLGVSSLNDQETTYILRGWISCCLCIFGLIGNLLSAIVLLRPSLRILPINVILLILTICDSLYIILYLFCWSIPILLLKHLILSDTDEQYIYLESYYMHYLRPLLYPYFYPLLWTAQNSSIGYTLFLTVERYIYVCKPMESGKMITRQRTIAISIIILICFIIYELPLWWRYKTIEAIKPNHEYCPTILIVQKNREYLDEIFSIIYFNKFKLLALHYLLPLLILFILNWKITVALKYIEKRRRRLTRSEVKNISYTRIVICVISLSCVTDVVFTIVAIVSHLRDQQHSLYSETIYVLLKDITDLLLLLNSSINFVFYSLLGTAFQHEFTKLFCKYKASNISELSELRPDSLRRQSTRESSKKKRSNL